METIKTFDNGDFVEATHEEYNGINVFKFFCQDTNSEMARMNHGQTCPQAFILTVFSDGSAVLVDDNESNTETHQVKFDQDKFEYNLGTFQNLIEVYDNIISDFVYTEEEIYAE